MHAAVSQGRVGVTASWCLQHVLCSFAQSHTRGYTVRWLHPGFAAPVCTMDRGTWLGKALWALHPSICQALCTATVRDHLKHQPQRASREGWSRAPHGQDLGLWLLPARARRAPSPWHFLQAAAASPCRGTSDQGCLCPPSSVFSTQGLGCHQP